MNKRIKELAEQARLWAEVSYKKQNDQFTSHWDTPVGYTVSQLFEQKFAELIVRECADITNKAENNDTEIRCMYDVITEYFGVE